MFIARQAFVLFLSSIGFLIGALPWTPFLLSLFLISHLMNAELSSVQFCRCCSGFFFDLLDESSIFRHSCEGSPVFVLQFNSQI